MKILVVGASKGIGRETVRQAIERGLDIRAMARRASEMRLAAPNLETFDGDALNPADVTAALDGVNVVVLALGISPSLERTFRPVHLFSEATGHLIAGMRNTGSRRIIAVTGFGAGDSYRNVSCLERLPFNLFLGQAYADKSRQERLIKDSGLDWTIVRPTILTNGGLTRRYQVLSDPSRWHNGLISRADVADFILDQADRPEADRAEVVLAY